MFQNIPSTLIENNPGRVIHTQTEYFFGKKPVAFVDPVICSKEYQNESDLSADEPIPDDLLWKQNAKKYQYTLTCFWIRCSDTLIHLNKLLAKSVVDMCFDRKSLKWQL